LSISNDISLPYLLKNVVEDYEEDRTDLLTIVTGDGNHSFLLNGCTYDTEEEEYVLGLFKAASWAQGSSNDSTLRITKDFSSFRTEGLEKELDSSDFVRIAFTHGDDIPTYDMNFSAYDLDCYNGDYFLYLPYGDSSEAFSLTAADETSLEFDGKSFSGDMEIREVFNDYSSDSARFKLKLAHSDKLVVEALDEKLDLEFADNTDYLSISSQGLNSAEIGYYGGDWDEPSGYSDVKLVGSDYDFGIYISSGTKTGDLSEEENNDLVGESVTGDPDEYDLYFLSGHANADVQINVADGQILLTTEGKVTEVCVSRLIMDGAVMSYPESGISELTINKYGEISAADGSTEIVVKEMDEAVDAVEALISDIGEVTYSIDCWEKITAAFTAYDGLSDYKKRMVSNYQTLMDTKTAFLALEAESPKYEVVLCSRVESKDYSVACLTGGGEYHYVRGGDIRAQTDVDGFDFVGWFTGYTTESNGTLFSEEAEVHVNPDNAIALTAVYEPKTGVTYRVSVAADEYEISGAEKNEADTYRCTPGTEITITYTDASRDLLYWTDAEGHILGRENALTFIATADTDITAFSLPAGSSGTYADVVFENIDGGLLCRKFYFINESIVFPEAPKVWGKTFVRWDMNQVQIRKAMAAASVVRVKPVYTESGE